MSLIKQLWLAIALVMLVAFAGSFLVSSLSAKAYLEEQLLLKNLDNATSLASTLSQMPKDEVTIELLISAQFDTGHYESIRLVDPSGKILVDRSQRCHGRRSAGMVRRRIPHRGRARRGAGAGWLAAIRHADAQQPCQVRVSRTVEQHAAPAGLVRRRGAADRNRRYRAVAPHPASARQGGTTRPRRSAHVASSPSRSPRPRNSAPWCVP